MDVAQRESSEPGPELLVDRVQDAVPLDHLGVVVGTEQSDLHVPTMPRGAGHDAPSAGSWPGPHRTLGEMESAQDGAELLLHGVDAAGAHLTDLLVGQCALR